MTAVRLRSGLRSRASVLGAVLLGAGLVLVVAAATPLFEPSADPEASYDAGFDAGRLETATPDPGELERHTTSSFARGAAYVRVPWQERFAAALLQLHAVQLAVAVGGPFDQGFEAGHADGLAGRPSRLASAE